MDREVNLVFDIETDGLLETVSTIHCIAIHDLSTGETIAYNDTGNAEPIVRGIQRLQDSDLVVGHGCIDFDLPVIRKLYPWFSHHGIVLDTLLLSRLYCANQKEIDFKRKADFMPGQLYGSHSLRAWGYRLGEYKGSFSEHTDWKDWSEAMELYCVQDVKVTTKLCQHFLSQTGCSLSTESQKS